MTYLGGLSLTELCRQTETDVGTIGWLVRDIGRQYVLQRNRFLRGKYRDLRVPNRRLKKIQRLLTARVLERVPPHPASYCSKGRGAVRAAAIHAGHPFILHIDISSFFPATSRRRVADAFARLGVPEETLDMLVGLVTLDDQLPQGAPPSVAVANLVMFDVDMRIGRLCQQQGLAYTRYVDDLAVSGGRRLGHHEQTIHRILKDEGWSPNEKGGLRGPTESHRYLGLVLNSHPNVDAQYLRDLRLVISRVERGRQQLSTREFQKLLGRVRYVQAVNPLLGTRLVAKVEGLCHS